MSKQLMQDAFPAMQIEINKAQRLTQKGALIEAEAIYLEILEQQENYPPALYGLAVLANQIDDKDVEQDLLSRAIEQIKQTEDRNQRSVLAIWLTEQAEVLMKLGRQNDAKACITESERIIKLNLS